MTGNWGGHRANAATQAAMDLDLKSGPATIICLQEAHEGVADVLAEPAPPPPPAVAGNGGEDRPQAQYYTLRANEKCNTNFIVVRVNLASALTSVRFQRTLDGFYRVAGGRRREARSRIQMAQVIWRKPVVGMTTTVVVNCHMHRMAAKRASGFAAGTPSSSTRWRKTSAMREAAWWLGIGICHCGSSLTSSASGASSAPLGQCSHGA